MAARKYKLTHDEHVALAKRVHAAFAIVQDAYVYVSAKNGVTSREAKQLARLFVRFDTARSALDAAYHSVTTNDEFAQAGHVYYGVKAAQ